MKKLVFYSFLALAATDVASAADAVVYEPAPEALLSSYDWSGFYAGVHAGYGWGKSETDDLYAYDLEMESGLGGLQAGYNHQFANNIVLGLEADVSFAKLEDDSVDVDDIFDFVTTAEAETKALGTVRGRLGYAFDRFLPYVTGGVGWAVQDVNYNQDLGLGFFTNVNKSNTYLGWTAGAGVEAAISDAWSVKAEYLYSDFGSAEYDGTSSFGDFEESIDLKAQTVKIGLNYRFN